MKRIREKKGFALIIVLMLTSIILFLGMSFVAAIISENKICRSQTESIKAYYLSESGIQEALWKIQNDPDWKNNFETDEDWEAEIIRADVFVQGAEFKVKIKNSGLANAEIVSAGLKKINNISKARRISKLNIFKAVSGGSPSGDGSSSSSSSEDESGDSIPDEGGEEQELQMNSTVLLASGSIKVWGADLNCQGNIFSEEDFSISLWSDIDAQGEANSCGNINIDSTSSLNALALHSQNYPPASDSMDMPAAGFDAEGDSRSIKAIAASFGQVFTAEEFKNLLQENPVRTFSEAVYVTGSISLGAGVNLAISGAIAADGSIAIGNDWQWWAPCGSEDARMAVSALPGKPSGIFSKNQIVIKTCVGNINISGIVYAGNSILFSSISSNFTVTGSVVARNIEGTGLWRPISLIFDEEIIGNSLRAESEFAPIIDSSHWED